MKKAILIGVMCALVSLPTLALAFQSEAPSLGSVDAIQKMNVKGLQMVESGGRTFFVSADGRYIIKGSMFDMWAGKKIESIAELNANANKIDFDKIGLKIEDLYHVSYGTGKEEVIMFSAPGCPSCGAMLKEIPALAEKYTFKIIPLPILGEESATNTKKLACASSPQKEVVAVMSGDYSSLPDATNECDLDGVRRSLVTAQVLGLDGVPFFITPDHRVLRGLQDDLDAALGGKS